MGIHTGISVLFLTTAYKSTIISKWSLILKTKHQASIATKLFTKL